MASFLKCFIIRICKHDRRSGQKDFAIEAMRKSCGNTNRQRESYAKAKDGCVLWSRFERQKPNSIIFFFVSSASFLVKSPYVIFSVSTSGSPVMLRFKIFMFLSL